jgi:hypothetical protein
MITINDGNQADAKNSENTFLIGPKAVIKSFITFEIRQVFYESQLETRAIYVARTKLDKEG